MASYDPALGIRVKAYLAKKGLENPVVDKPIHDDLKHVENELETDFRDILLRLGLDQDNPSLSSTASRIAKMYTYEIFYGLNYDKFPMCSTFLSNSDEMVAVRKIAVKSMCEHHFLPFIGHAIVAYIPHRFVIGISKLNRIVDFFSRRPQMQERLTEQIAETVGMVLSTPDVAVAITAEHHCTRMRGVKDEESETVTSKLLGRFRTVPELRNERIGLTR